MISVGPIELAPGLVGYAPSAYTLADAQGTPVSVSVPGSWYRYQHLSPANRGSRPSPPARAAPAPGALATPRPRARARSVSPRPSLKAVHGAYVPRRSRSATSRRRAAPLEELQALGVAFVSLAAPMPDARHSPAPDAFQHPARRAAGAIWSKSAASSTRGCTRTATLQG